MTVIIDHVFWYRDRRGEDMECDFSYLVIRPSGESLKRHSCGQTMEDSVKAEFPEAIFLGGKVSVSVQDRRETKLSGDLEMVQRDHPEAHATLAAYFGEIMP